MDTGWIWFFTKMESALLLVLRCASAVGMVQSR
jgi:hypothetical protein